MFEANSPMTFRTILDNQAFQITLKRLALELIENHTPFDQHAIIGLQPRGIFLSHRLTQIIEQLSGIKVLHGEMDATFYRDDFKQKPLFASPTQLDFELTDKKVILIDDVLYTGRSVRSAMDAMQSFGRPVKTELLVLIDRRFSREVPVQPDYTGIRVDAVQSERVKVIWNKAEKWQEQVIIESKF